MPIVAHDFSTNSYARTELGVQRNWRLSEIGNRNVDGLNFNQVVEMLNEHMRDFPLWPLRVEFQTGDDPSSTRSVSFLEQPVGLEIPSSVPCIVSRVFSNSPASKECVEPGWRVLRVGDKDVKDLPFLEVWKCLRQGTKPLNDTGERYVPRRLSEAV